MFVKKYIFLFVIMVSSFLQSGISQDVLNPNFDKKIRSLLDLNVATISVGYAHDNCSDYIFLDAREEEEYNVSHIPDAIHIGYEHFKLENLTNIPKDAKIIVYCSIGYRSEKVGEKLETAGYTKIENLYGSIFEWVNQGYNLEDSKDNVTSKLHTYNKDWSKWVEHPEIIKTW